MNIARALLPLAAGLGLLSGAASAYDYRALHMIEDRHSHVIIRISEPPEGGDPPARGQADCAEIDVLSRMDKNVAGRFGRMFQRSGIHIDTILTSRLCRDIHAARMLQIGPADETPLLDPPAPAPTEGASGAAPELAATGTRVADTSGGGADDAAVEARRRAAEAQAEDLLGLIDGLAPSETAMLIGAPEVIHALTGEDLAPGEGLVFTLPPFGEPELRARFDLPPL